MLTMGALGWGVGGGVGGEIVRDGRTDTGGKALRPSLQTLPGTELGWREVGAGIPSRRPRTRSSSATPSWLHSSLRPRLIGAFARGKGEEADGDARTKEKRLA